MSVEELKYAAQVSQRTLGNTDVAKVIKETTAMPTRAKKYWKLYNSASKKAMVKKFTPQRMLALFVEDDFIRKQWELIKIETKISTPDTHWYKTKKKSYFDKESIRMIKTTAETQIQALLDHTALQLYKYVSERS